MLIPFQHSPKYVLWAQTMCVWAMASVIVLLGPSSVGKSSISKQLSSMLTATIIAADDVFDTLTKAHKPGDGPWAQLKPKVRPLMVAAAARAVKAGHNVLLDDIEPGLPRMLQAARVPNVLTVLVLASPHILRKRALARDSRRPLNSVWRSFTSLVAPCAANHPDAVMAVSLAQIHALTTRPTKTWLKAEAVRPKVPVDVLVIDPGNLGPRAVAEAVAAALSEDL